MSIKVGSLGYCMTVFWGEGAQCTQHSGGFPLGEPKWGHSFPTWLVFIYHRLPLAERFISVPSREIFGLKKKKVELIERTNRAFFFFLSRLELHVSGNEAPA